MPEVMLSGKFVGFIYRAQPRLRSGDATKTSMIILQALRLALPSLPDLLPCFRLRKALILGLRITPILMTPTLLVACPTPRIKSRPRTLTPECGCRDGSIKKDRCWGSGIFNEQMSRRAGMTLHRGAQV